MNLHNSNDSSSKFLSRRALLRSAEGIILLDIADRNESVPLGTGYLLHEVCW